ncbi:MAG: type IV pilus modification protein PilV [Steroidobacteraceae bacterium]
MTILKHKSQQSAARSAGFTLVEVLVSLVILSIGLLGIAKLMLLSSHANDSAYLRSQATALAYEILDNMRANRVEAIAQNYDTPLGAAPVLPAVLCTPPLATCTTANQVTKYDIYEWRLRLNANRAVVPPALPGALPNGDGRVATVIVGAQTQVTITVQWDDSVAQNTLNVGAPNAPQVITLETVL